MIQELIILLYISGGAILDMEQMTSLIKYIIDENSFKEVYDCLFL